MTRPGKSSLSSIRAAAQLAVEESSLRDVADQIPMSWAGLRNFLNGSTPQRATSNKLAAWFVRRQKGSHIVMPPSEVDAAVGVLVAYIESGRGDVGRQERRAEVLARLK